MCRLINSAPVLLTSQGGGDPVLGKPLILELYKTQKTYIMRHGKLVYREVAKQLQQKFLV